MKTRRIYSLFLALVMCLSLTYMVYTPTAQAAKKLPVSVQRYLRNRAAKKKIAKIAVKMDKMFSKMEDGEYSNKKLRSAVTSAMKAVKEAHAYTRNEKDKKVLKKCYRDLKKIKLGIGQVDQEEMAWMFRAMPKYMVKHYAHYLGMK